MGPTMTSRISAACGSRRLNQGSAARRAFTLVELLVVIGIIVLLVGLATPMITRAWKAGDRAATFADLQAIATALEAYRQDHGDYPRVRQETGISNSATRPNPPTGAQILCQALIGPAPATEPGAPANQRAIQDGVEGPGFRVRAQGRVFGPYLPASKFKIGDPANLNTPLSTPAPGRWLLATILDRYNKPILYFPASPAKPNIRVAGSPPPFVGQSELSMYDQSDNFITGSFTPFDTNGGNAMRKMRQMLGDINNNGYLDNGESEAYTGPFILWSSGPDETFGPAPGPTGTPAEIRKAVDKSDDITNFRQ